MNLTQTRLLICNIPKKSSNKLKSTILKFLDTKCITILLKLIMNMKRSVTKTKPAFTILSRLHEHKHRLLNDTTDDLNHSIGQALGQGPKKLDLRCNDLRLTNIQSLKNQIILRHVSLRIVCNLLVLVQDILNFIVLDFGPI